MFLKHLIICKKTAMFLAIILLIAPGFLPHGFVNSRQVVKNNQVFHAKLCCCGNVASACRDCCCSDDHTENDNTGESTVTITACGGTSDDIITISKLNYILTLPSIINYTPVSTLAKAIIPRRINALLEPPYKPPKLQLLTNLIILKTTFLT
jgi:hypothetical protein